MTTPASVQPHAFGAIFIALPPIAPFYGNFMSTFYLRAIIAPLLLLPLFAQAQNPWTRSAGGGFAQMGWNSISAEKKFIDGVGVPLSRTIQDNTLGLYGEYGVRKRFTVIADLPIKILSVGDTIAHGIETMSRIKLPSEGKLTGLGNIGLAAKYQLLKNVPLTAQLRVDAPTSSYDATTDLNTGYNALTISPSLMFGVSGQRYFAAVGVGYAYRTAQFNSDVFADAQVGVSFFKKRLYLILPLTLRAPLLSSVARTPPAFANTKGSTTGLYPYAQGYFAFGLKLFGNITPHLGASLYGFVVGADQSINHQVLAAPSIGGGISYKWGE